MARLEDIEGIAEGRAAKLRSAGVRSVAGLLKAGATPAGRHALAASSGQSKDDILTWVNHADLFRITGVAGQFAELLEAAGVDSVPELATRKPENLVAALAEANGKRQLVRRLPSLSEVNRWVAEAKSLDRAVSH